MCGRLVGLPTIVPAKLRSAESAYRHSGRSSRPGKPRVRAGRKVGFPRTGLIHRVKRRLGSTPECTGGWRELPLNGILGSRSRTNTVRTAGGLSGLSDARQRRGWQLSDIGKGERARATGGGGGSGSKCAGALREQIELALNLGTGTPGRVGNSGVLGLAVGRCFDQGHLRSLGHAAVTPESASRPASSGGPLDGENKPAFSPFSIVAN